MKNQMNTTRNHKEKETITYKHEKNNNKYTKIKSHQTHTKNLLN